MHAILYQRGRCVLRDSK